MNIVDWLSEIGFSQYAESFVKNGIDDSFLLDLTNEDLKDLGVARLADRKRILQAIEKLLAGQDGDDRDAQTEQTMSGDRRPVTVLFADLVNFSGLSNQLGAEKIHAVLNSYFARVDLIIENYGGHIDKHIGDSAMAIFGAPVAHTDDPERAVRAAVDIHAAMKELSDELGHDLSVHIGIASGQVVASGTGSDSHREFTVTGETVNLASRLDELAGPGETFVSHAISEALAGRVTFASRGQEKIKGFDEAIPVWSVEKLNETGNLAPRGQFVGRDAELKLFSAALEFCNQTGQGQGFLVRGDAGLGKTRLIVEFARLAERLGFATHSGLVLDFGVGVGRDAIRSLVRSLLELSSSATSSRRQQAADKAVASGWIDESDKLFLSDLLDLQLTAEDRALYAAMDDKTRISGRHSVLSALIRCSAEKQPCLIIVEDIHWADRVTRNYLTAITDAIGASPSILVLTSRMEGPAMDTNWLVSHGACSMTTIDLQPLKPEEAFELAKLLGKEHKDAIETLTERADGNPLFLEQLIRNIAERSKDALPDTLHGVVLSRVDSLDQEDREILQAASVLGQRFSLDDLNGLTKKTATDCTPLIRHRLLRPESDEFIFVHALIREGVYASLLQERRIQLHRQAAEWFADRDKALRAEHLERAEDPNAVDAYLEAAVAEAELFHFTRALQLTESGVDLARDRSQLFKLLHAKGQILLDISDLDAASKVFEQALETSNTDIDRCLALVGLASVMRLTDRVEEAFPLLNEAQRLGENHDMYEELSKLHHLRGNLLFPLGKTEECFNEHKRALDYAKKTGGIEAEVRALGGLGDAEYARGRMRAAHTHFRDCLDLSREHGFTRIEVVNANMVGGGGTHYYLNELDAALEASAYAAEMGERLGMNRAALLAHVSLSMIWCEKADFEKAEHHATVVREMAESSGTRRFIARADQLAGKLYIERGESQKAAQVLRNGIEVSRATGVGYVGASILASLARATEDPEECAAALRDGQELLDQGCVSHNYFEYYCEAMELMLARNEWDKVEPYAQALETFASNEPLPRSDFFIARARALARIGAGDTSDETVVELKALQDQCEQVGLAVAKQAIDRALLRRSA